MIVHTALTLSLYDMSIIQYDPKYITYLGK